MATTDRMNFLAKEDIKDYYTSFVGRLKVSHPEFMEKISSTGKFEEDDAKTLDSYLDDYNETYLAEHIEYRGED